MPVLSCSREKDFEYQGSHKRDAKQDADFKVDFIGSGRIVLFSLGEVDFAGITFQAPGVAPHWNRFHLRTYHWTGNAYECDACK